MRWEVGIRFAQHRRDRKKKKRYICQTAKKKKETRTNPRSKGKTKVYITAKVCDQRKEDHRLLEEEMHTRTDHSDNHEGIDLLRLLPLVFLTLSLKKSFAKAIFISSLHCISFVSKCSTGWDECNRGPCLCFHQAGEISQRRKKKEKKSEERWGGAGHQKYK